MVRNMRHVTDPHNRTLAEFDESLIDPEGPIGPKGREIMERIDRISANPAAELNDDITQQRHRRFKRFLREHPMADELVNGEMLAAAAGADLTPGGAVTDSMRTKAMDLLTGNMDAVNERAHINAVARN